MSSARSSVFVLACVALLVSQIAGLHMHIDADGYVGQPQSTHVHPTAGRGHDGVSGVEHADDLPAQPDVPGHEGNRDVPAVDPGAGVSKVLIVFAWLALGLIVILAPSGKLRVATTRVSGPTSRRERWRPPLRGPPIAISHSAT